MAYILFLFVFALLSIFIIPKRYQFVITFSAELLLSFFSGYLAVQAFSSEEICKMFFGTFLGNEVFLVIDKISAFFILVVNLIVLMGLIYSKGYLQPYRDKKTKTELGLHYFSIILLHLSMLFVLTLREGISFLIAWEVMSLATFILILFENEVQQTVKAAVQFIIQMHVAFVFIVVAFLIASIKTGLPIGFDSLELYFQTVSVFPLFLLFFAGFGIKAGFILLHTWLPHAHPAAPSHISGIMSGVIIKMGIYGIVRVLTYIHTDLYNIGLFLLIISFISGILGVTLAIVQHDYKKLLAYHSIENIGIPRCRPVQS